MQGWLENSFANDTNLDPRPLPSLHMRKRCSALSTPQACLHTLMQIRLSGIQSARTIFVIL